MGDPEYGTPDCFPSGKVIYGAIRSAKDGDSLRERDSQIKQGEGYRYRIDPWVYIRELTAIHYATHSLSDEKANEQRADSDKAKSTPSPSASSSLDLTRVQSAGGIPIKVQAEVFGAESSIDLNSASGEEGNKLSTHSSCDGAPLPNETSNTCLTETAKSSSSTTQQGANLDAAADSTTSHSGEPMETSGVPFSKLSSVTASPQSSDQGHVMVISSSQKYRAEMCHRCDDYRASSLMR